MYILINDKEWFLISNWYEKIKDTYSFVFPPSQSLIGRGPCSVVDIPHSVFLQTASGDHEVYPSVLREDFQSHRLPVHEFLKKIIQIGDFKLLGMAIDCRFANS